MQITSRHNPLLKEIQRALAAGVPTPDGLIAAEGPHLVEEAQRSSWHVARILATNTAFRKFAGLCEQPDIETIQVDESAFERLASTDHTQGIVALLRPRRWQWADLLRTRSLLVVLDSVSDPGNAGTIVRSAEAFGATGIVLKRGSVHLANSKFLRATAGSIFRVPFLEGLTHEDVVEGLQSAGIQMVALSGAGHAAIHEIDFAKSSALIIGNEGSGLSDQWRTSASFVRIPTVQVESLNAAVAGSVALFEAFRQRAMPHGLHHSEFQP